ncbi:MAG: hypothetical protein PF637_05900 [Spirochaetes bacterium]|jgi:hypothetical protein|nr:hypothetical protein [Spirochaetota bacterium]
MTKNEEMKKLIEYETRKQTVSFWGEEYTIQPVLSKTKLGDGLQLIYVGTTDQRPHFWLIRIDSHTDVLNDDFNIYEIVDILEEEFGRHPYRYVDKEDFYKNDDLVEQYGTYEEYDSACNYPAVWWGEGHWGVVENLMLSSRARLFV